MTQPADRRQAIIQDADRCVKCAACLPHCPTYRISGNEAESPRGRIALMQMLAENDGAPAPGLQRHLDQCLTCRSCEPVCPADVRYGRLLDNARAEQAARSGPSLTKRLGLMLLPRRRAVRALAGIIRLARRAGLGRLLPVLGRITTPPSPGAWRADHPTTGTPAGKIGLFTGCVADVLDVEARDSAIRVLNAVGYDVVMPPAQTCCGALHQHSGLGCAADSLARRNREAFESAGVETVISTVTGCGAQLSEHVFGDRHRDICGWLTEEARALPLERLDADVAVHVPCTQRNVLGEADAAARLVSLIPGARVKSLPVDPKCCGAAGTYMLEHPGIADTLGRERADSIARLDPDYIVTANVGCASHLADHLRRLGSRAEVLHPVTLVARQLSKPGPG